MSPWLDSLLAHAAQIPASGGHDLASTLIVTLVVAVGGAGVGLILVGLRALGARRRARARAQARATFPPDVPHTYRRVPRALLPASVDDSPTAPGITVVEVSGSRGSGSPRSAHVRAEPEEHARPAGEVWLSGFMAKLRVALPGLEQQAPDPDPRRPLALRAPFVRDPIREACPGAGADATLQIDASTLARIVRDLGETDAVTLALPDAKTLCADATVKTGVLALVTDRVPASGTRVHEVGALGPSRASGRPPSPSPIGFVEAAAMEMVVPDVGTFQYGARRG